MAAVEWSFVEDGSLSVGEQTVDLAYHPKLNTILAVTEEPAVRVLDVNSGVTLQKSTLSAQSGSSVKCHYIGEVDQVFFTDGRVVGLRKDLSGVLLLESALQTAVSKADDHVIVELPHSEASQLLALACLIKPQRSGQEFWDEVQNEIQASLQNCKVNSVDHTYHKVNKWATVVLRLPHCALRSVCKTLLTEMRRSNQHIPGLTIAAGIMDRLQALYPEPNQSLGTQTVDRAQMYSEAARRETFATWPHMNYKWALPEPMAQAGFYHQPTSPGDDRAMCFTCSVCLVCWEPTDEPWSEHERHSPNCPFVLGEPTENVPLSTTLATSPAQYHWAEVNNQIVCTSTSSCSFLMATSIRHGNISIWNVANQLRLVTNFTIDPKDPAITGKAVDESESKAKVIEAWTEETSQSEIKTIPSSNENSKTGTGSKHVDDKEDIHHDLEKDSITKSSDREENYGSIEVIEVGGAWRFPEDGPSTEVKNLEDIPQIKPIGMEPQLLVQETLVSSPATLTTPSKDLIVSALCIVAGMRSKTAPPVQPSINPNTSQPNSPSKHIADIDNVAPPCLLAGVSLCIPKDAQLAPSEAKVQKNTIVEELIPSTDGDEAGLGIDISNRKLIFTDSCFGDTVDSRSNSPVDEIDPTVPAVQQRHCLLVYRTKPKVKEPSSRKTAVKAKGNLYKSSGMYSLPTLSMSEILEMEEEQQVLVEEPIGLEELSVGQASGIVLADTSTNGTNSKTSSITNEKALQCVDLPVGLQRDDLWISNIVPCLDRQHILVIVGPHDGHLQNSGNSSNVNKCNTVQCESRNNISQQNDLNKGSAFEDKDKQQDSKDSNQSFNKPFAKFFSENMLNEEASGGPSVEDIAIGDSECIKPFAKFFSENPALSQNSGSSNGNDFVPQDPGEDSGSIHSPFAKLFAGNNEDLTSGKTDSRFFPRKSVQGVNGSKSDKPFAKYFSGGNEKDSQSNEGYVLVYKLQCVSSVVTIVPEPVYIHAMGDTCKSFTKVVPLPTEMCDSGSDEESDIKPDIIPHQPEELTWAHFDESDSKGNQNEPALGKFAALSNEGKVIVFDAATFNILATVLPSDLQSPKMVDRTSANNKFVAMTYCTGMERLCVCSLSGHITFLQLATKDMDRVGKRSKRLDKIDADQDKDSGENTDAPDDETGDDYLTTAPLTQENLATMRLLTQFETLVPRFSATVPPCWAEIQQEQQQRRHPQHLHQRQQGDATQHTRTWKLQPNGSKDHLFELVLPKACCVGHVDIKFTLHPLCLAPPKIQLTLLRQSGSQCHKIERETDAMNIKSVPVDAQINFNMDSPTTEPKEQNVNVTSTEQEAGIGVGPHFRKDFNFTEDSLMKSLFLRQHREDIVCGPCDLECFVDMPSHTGVVTLTSRELMLSKNRSFLLHICGQEGLSGEAGAGGKGTNGHKGTPILPVLQSNPATSTTRLASGSISVLKEIERYKGCDWVQELSITIRRTRKVNVPRDRLQRVMMLESMDFHNSLVETVTGMASDDGDSRVPPPDFYTKELGLEILCWIAGVQICEPHSRTDNTMTLVETIQKHLQALIKTCYLDSDRSIAHKCSRLLALCIGCTMRGKNPGAYDSFRHSLLQSLLHWLPVLPCATSAGALNWFFTLLNMVKQVNTESTSQACVSLLTLVAKHLEERMIPAHSILRARFCLYGTPLDPILFDIEPTIPVAKGSSKPAGISASPYHQGVMSVPIQPGVNVTGGTFGEEMDIYGNQVASSKLSKDGSATSLGGTHFMRGLLEVEPLHFMCCSTSDGTHVERIGAGHESIASAIAMSAGSGNPSEGYTGGPSAALASLSTAMASAEQQLQMLQHKTHALIKLHQQKHKLEQKLQETSNSNSLPSQGFTEVFPATPKSTPFFMTPPLTPPNESSAQFGPSSLWDVPDMYSLGMSPYLAKYSGKGSKAVPGTPKGKGKAPDTGRSSTESLQTNPTLVRNLLNPPQSHVLVIDRMHSGARRFAVLDFGRPILLTDIYIPSCSDLASLSVDVWNQGEEQDGRRLAVALDIGTKDLVMNDLLPPAVCRFLKLTVVGRYGGNAVRSKIPLGVFYGHTFFSSHEQASRDGQDSDSGFSDGQQTQQEQYLNLALAVQEDIQCRYSLACNRLEKLLSNVDIQNGPAAFMRSEKMDGSSDIQKAYQECMQLQQQLNVVQRTIGRLQQSITPSVATQTTSTCTSVQAVKQASSDELQMFCEYLLDTLLGVTNSADPLPVTLNKQLNMDTCKSLFKHLCVVGTPQLRLRTGTLLVRVCSSQYWWGEFLASSLNEFFNSDQNLIFPQDRVFLLLASLGQKSLIANNSVLEHLLTLLAKLLSPLNGHAPTGFSTNTGPLDLSLVGWVLLFLSRTLDHTVGSSTASTTAAAAGSAEGDELEENGAVGGAAAAATGVSLPSAGKISSHVTTDKDKGGSICSSRWDFMTSNGHTLGSQHSSGGVVNRGHLQSRIQSKLKKQLQLHKEQLTQLQSMHKAIQAKAVEEGKDNDPIMQVQIKKKLQQHASKHLRDILRIRRITERNLRARGLLAQPVVSQDKPTDSPLPEVHLLRQNCIPVLQGLMQLLLAMDFTCHVDLFLVTCKVLARIANATRPAITLSEIASSDQLTKLLLLCVSSEHNQGMSSWGGPWASHAITCLLQDILEGERLYPFSDDFRVADSNVAMSEDTSDLDSDLTPETILDDVEAAGGANGSDESESNGGDIFSEGTVPTEPTYMSAVPEPDIEFIGTPLDPYDSQYMDHVIFGSSKYDDFDWPEKGHPMKVACKFGASTSPFGSSHKTRAKYKGSPPPTADTLKGGGALLPSVSMAMDARLEQGLELQVEWYLKVTSLMDAHSVGQTFSGPLSVPPAPTHVSSQTGDYPSTDDALAANMASSRRQVEPSTNMLSKCFNQLFGQLQYNRVQLDSLLQLWLQVLETNPDVEKQDNSFDATLVPSIPLNQSSVNKLLASLAWQLNMPVHTWCLAFHALSVMANSRDDVGLGAGIDFPTMANNIVTDTNLLPALVHFLSGSALHGTAGSQHYTQVGPTVTQALYEFLSRLQIKLASSQTPNTLALKELLLKLVHILSEPSGAFHTGRGPLDAQVRFLDFVVEQAFGRTEVNNIVTMINSISILVHNHITRTQRVAQYTNSDTNVNARSCFGGLFASMLRPGDVRSSGGEASRDVLMCSLLQLVNQLIEVPLDEDSAARFIREMPRQDIAVSTDLGSLPVTDSSKLNFSLIVGAGPTDGPMSDDDKERSSSSEASGHSTMSASAAPAEQQQVPRICDIVLSNKETISLLLSALNHCSSNTMASIIGSSTLYPSASDSFANVDPLSVGDNIFQILCTMGSKSYSVELMLRPLLSYMSTNQGKTGCSLSEPLLWFILKILGEQKSLQAFHDMGGVRIVCSNLVISNRAVIDTTPSTVSAIMQHLGSTARTANSASSSSSSRSNRTVIGAMAEVDSIDGLVNFAPYGSINSSSATAQPAEVLLQPTPPHRRARSAAWSYHFYPDEAWCDLHITLPNAILLKEVHIQPHLTSLATCPSSVSLEISADGSTTVPICPPLPTSGLTYVKLQLPRPEITTSVCLRLHRPRDSNTIGLSQIMLLGVTAFGNAGNGSQTGLLVSSDDNAAKSSIRWLRLLHHCLTQVPSLELPIANTASRMPALLTTCSSLLLSPHCQVYAANIEAVMLKLGLCCTDVGLTMFDLLLRNNYSTGDEEHTLLMLGYSAGVSSHSTVDIIFQLGTSQNQGLKDRVQALLDWLGDTARVALRKHSHFHRAPHTLSPAEAGLLNPAPAHVHCVATIIWASHQQATLYSVASLLSNELFSSVYEWSMVLPLDSALKRAADFVLCAMCYVHPSLFESLLQWMGITLESGLDFETSLTDDNKDAQEHAVRFNEDTASRLTDDTKEAAAIHQTPPAIDGYVQFPVEEFAHVMLDESHLSTLAVACQSETATDRILDSGFPAILAQALAEFCSQEIMRNQNPSQLLIPGMTDASKIKAARSPRSARGFGARSSSEPYISEPVVSLTADLISPVLYFFTELCSQLKMKNWLGSAEGSVFWTSLLTLLCNISSNNVQSPLLIGSPKKQQVLTSSQRSSVESATITFYSKCITCHETNQKLLAQVICDVTCSRGTQAGIRFAISGFTRRLILQLMLEDEKLTMFLKATFRLYKSQQSISSHLEHPQFGTGHNYKVVEAKLASSCAQLVTQVSDTPSSSLLNDKPKSSKEESSLKTSSHSYSKSIFFTKESNLLSSKDDIEQDLYGNYSTGSLATTNQASGPESPYKMKQKKVAVFDKENNNSSPQLPPHPQKHTAPATAKLFMSMPSLDSRDGGLQVPRVHLTHELLSTKGLPDTVTLAQLVGVLQQKGMPLGFPMVQFGLNIRKEDLDASKTDSSKSAEAEEAASSNAARSTSSNSADETALFKSLLDAPAIPSFLHVFASLGGLALIAEHLPIVYHDVPRQSGAEESQRDRQSDKWADNLNMAWQLTQAASETWAPMEPVVEEIEVYEPPTGASSMVPGSGASSSSPVSSAAAIPPHSLGAFGLFLRLPGYAEVLLKEHKKAQFLLRLVLGVTDDGDGGHILMSPQATTLPTLPFTVLVALFDSTPLTTDDGVLLRRMTLEIGAVHLILACLAVLSHHGPRVSNGVPSVQEQLPGPPTQPTGIAQGPTIAGEKGSQSYWAKGTGFGTGSTSSGWNVEQALIRQKAEEEHVTCLLKVLSSYINPSGSAWDQVSASGGAAAAAVADGELDDNNMDQLQNIFPAVFVELLSQSCLIPAISSYLRNDSVLDMARHVPLYCALLEILRALALCPMLATLLLPQNGNDQVSGSETSVVSLLENMKSCVDTYTSRLKFNIEGKPSSSHRTLREDSLSGEDTEAETQLGASVRQSVKERIRKRLNKEGKTNSRRALGKDTTLEEDADAEGLTQLVPEIQRTVEIVTRATSKLIAEGKDEMDREDLEGSSSAGSSTKISMEEYYVSITKKMQFDTYRMITEDDDGKINFVIAHHYASNVKSAGNVNNASRARRLAQEAVTLSNSLPLTASSSVFVRCDEDKLDVMKVLITGPSDTPYANGCFEFDVYFPADYPVSPMLVNLETTGQHSVRFNPNLYNDGKVCLSVLNTWHGRPEEKWNAQTSSFLQVLVSIQSLILVSEPYFNEPGYERSRGTPSGTQSSREYDANIMQASVKWAMLEMLRNPPACFKETIQTHFYLKRAEVMAQCEDWINQLAQLCNDKRVGRSVAHHWAALKRHTAQLREELAKLKPTKILLEEANKARQEKAGSPIAVSALAPANLEPSHPVTASGTSDAILDVEQKPAAAETDPLEVAPIENLYGGGHDTAGLF